MSRFNAVFDRFSGNTSFRPLSFRQLPFRPLIQILCSFHPHSILYAYRKVLLPNCPLTDQLAYRFVCLLSSPITIMSHYLFVCSPFRHIVTLSENYSSTFLVVQSPFRPLTDSSIPYFGTNVRRSTNIISICSINYFE